MTPGMPHDESINIAKANIMSDTLLSHSENLDTNLGTEDLQTQDQLQKSLPKKSLLEVTLAGAIALSKDAINHAQANEQFEAMLAQIQNESPTAALLLKQLWAEYLAAQRSATFYEGLSGAEAGLSEKMVKGNIQLKQNYLRLIQEQ